VLNTVTDTAPSPPCALPGDWLPHLARVAAAQDLSLFWECLGCLLQKAVPHHTAFMWCDYLDFGASSKSTSVFETPHRDRPPEYWGERRKYHLTAGFLRSHAGLKLYRMDDVVPREEIVRSEFYRRFMQPEGWEHAVTLAFWQKDELRAALVLYRTEAQGSYSCADTAALTALHPFIEGIVFRQLDQHRRRTLHARVEDFVRGLPIGLILLNWDLQPVFVNDEGYKQTFYWIHGPTRPRALHYRDDYRVPPEFRRVCENYRRAWVDQYVSGQGVGNAGIERVAHPDHPDIQVVISTQSVYSISAHRPSFLIQFEGLSLRAQMAFKPSETQLKLLSQLTPGQRVVAILLLQGLSNPEIATKLNLGRSTVKDHLSHIYRRLQVRNRTQLAGLLSQ
jgi:DNA-binding CsgD family transcriptional regulator